MVEYSTFARQEMRARQKFFQHDILWWILYTLSIFKILISFKSIAIDAFEYWIFSWKIQKKKLNFFKNFPNPHFLEKIEFSKKNFKLQIALKNSLFELWPNKKNCNEISSWRLHFQKNYWRARTSMGRPTEHWNFKFTARGARWILHRCENSKIMVFWHRW